MADHDGMINDAVVFDLDGTLVDSLPGIADALNAALAIAGFPQHPASEVRGFVGDGLETTVRRASPPGTCDAIVASVVDDFRAAYADVWKSATRPYHGIGELLVDLQDSGVLLAVLSNKSHAFAVEMVAEIFAGIDFACVLGLGPGMEPKPDPAGAMRVLASLRCPANRCVLVGDSTVDIDTARRSGMRSCAVGWGYHDVPSLEAAGPDALVHDVPSLRRWIATESPSPGDIEACLARGCSIP